jgi:hypothetical protein
MIMRVVKNCYSACFKPYSLALIALLILGPLETSYGQVESSSCLPETLTASLPQSPTCVLQNIQYAFEKKAQNAWGFVIEGNLLNQSPGKVSLILEAGFKNRQRLQKEPEHWVWHTSQKREFTKGLENQRIRLVKNIPENIAGKCSQENLCPLLILRESESGNILNLAKASLSPWSATPGKTGQGQVLEGVREIEPFRIHYSCEVPHARPGQIEIVFSGTVEHAEAKPQDLLLKCGFISAYGAGPDGNIWWAWSGKDKVPIKSGTKQSPFAIKVKCPGGVAVGLERGAYQPEVALLTEAEQKALEKQQKRAARMRPIPKENIHIDSTLIHMQVKEARYQLTSPGQAGNSGLFSLVLHNEAEEPEKVRVYLGFLPSKEDPEKASAPWYNKTGKTIELEPDRQTEISGEVPCHIRMHDLIEQGRLAAWISIMPEENP